MRKNAHICRSFLWPFVAQAPITQHICNSRASSHAYLPDPVDCPLACHDACHHRRPNVQNACPDEIWEYRAVESGGQAWGDSLASSKSLLRRGILPGQYSLPDLGGGLREVAESGYAGLPFHFCASMRDLSCFQRSTVLTASSMNDANEAVERHLGAVCQQCAALS